MENNYMKLKVEYIQVNDKDKHPSIFITDKEVFEYSNMRNLYEGKKDGHGIQVNNRKDEKILLNMCDKIADIVYETKEKINASSY